MDSLRAAEEARFFRMEDDLALKRRMERFVQRAQASGQAGAAALLAGPSSSSSHLNDFERERLAAAKASLADYRPQRVKSSNPLKVHIDVDGHARNARLAHNTFIDYLKVPQVSMGRSKWEVHEDASIFSVKDGKKLAVATVDESAHLRTTSGAKAHRVKLARQLNIEAQAVDQSTFKNIRIYPKLSAGRAFAWGTVLAVWGTGVMILGARKAWKIESVEDLDSFVQRNMEKPVGSIKANLEKNFKPSQDASEKYQSYQDGRLVNSLKSKFA